MHATADLQQDQDVQPGSDAHTHATPASPKFSTPLTIKRISPALGVEVSGIDLRQPLSDAQAADLRSALVAHKVLVFRDQFKAQCRCCAASARGRPTRRRPQRASP